MTDVKVPDIGDFSDVPVIAVLVSVGDTIEKEDPLVELESDKATMEVPSSHAGKVTEIKVSEGDTVTQGDVILTVEAAEEEGGDDEDEDGGGAEAPTKSSGKSSGKEKKEEAPAPEAATGTSSGSGDLHGEVVVLGSGPGGYTAAFRAADLGKKVVLIERYSSLGGVCLNVGCIPSKALLHASKVITETEEMAEHGLDFGKAKVDAKKLGGWKDSVVKKMTGGLAGMAKQRKVTTVEGSGTFTGANSIEVETADGKTTVTFDQCIIAAGSQPVELPFVPHDDERIVDSTGALQIDPIPKKMCVLGGGIIGFEMATVYDALGSDVTVIEMLDQILPGADKDVVKPLQKRMEGRMTIHTKSKVTEVKAQKGGLKVTWEDAKGESSTETFDKMLVAVGRSPNGAKIAAEKAGVKVTERGFIEVDDQQRTNVDHIFAIGDVVGQPMLAHKAVHEGKVAAEVCAGEKRAFDARVIPSVAYTDPEVAWCGVTEAQAKERGLKVEKGVFPWAASGRAQSNGRAEGMTKLIFDPEDDRVIGGAIVGTNAGDLISEVALAIEMGADSIDLGHTIHPHPTLSETVNFAAEMFDGTITDLIPPKKKK